MVMNKETLSWNDIEDLTETIIMRMKLDNWFPNLIIGLTRGGLIPASMLSHALRVEMSALDVSLRDSRIVTPVTDTRILDWAKKGKKVLVVDDINDSGATFDWVKKDWIKTLCINEDQWPNEIIKFAALIHNSPSMQPIDYYGRIVNKELDPIWFEFPFEVWHKNR